MSVNKLYNEDCLNEGVFLSDLYIDDMPSYAVGGIEHQDTKKLDKLIKHCLTSWPVLMFGIVILMFIELNLN